MHMYMTSHTHTLYDVEGRLSVYYNGYLIYIYIYILILYVLWYIMQYYIYVHDIVYEHIYILIF